MSLPILRTGVHEQLAVVDPDTGTVNLLATASDRALAHAADLLAEHDAFVLQCKRAVAHELRERYGVGKAEAGGYEFRVTESTSWPMGPVSDALTRLVAEGSISEGDVRRCVPDRPKPNPVQLKALLGRLMVSDPDAARVLAAAATTSPPSVRDVRAVAVDAEQAA